MPFLESELGPGVAEGLARTAAILGQDADYLDTEALRVYESLAERPAPAAEVGSPAAEVGPRTAEVGSPAAEVGSPAAEVGPTILLPGEEVRALPAALRSRVLALAVVELGGQPTFERLAAVERLLERHGSAGPIEVPGHVSVRRQPRRKDAAPGAEYGKLVFVSHR
jgi:tRNA(Ile)-lysidine synthase